MMGRGAFTLLNVGRAGPKSAKRVENRLAILPKILGIAVRMPKSPRWGQKKTWDYCNLRYFREIWIIRPE
jgi:hypothetical protein